MKKTLALLSLVCALLLALVSSAKVQAVENWSSIQWDGVHAPLLDAYAAYTVTGWVHVAGTNWGFVALKKGNQNILAGFSLQGGKWTQQFVNPQAFPQGEMRMLLDDTSGSDKWSEKGVFLEQAGLRRWGKALYFGWSNGEYYENQCIFELDDKGIWQLSHYAHAGQSGMMDVTADALYFLEESKENFKIKARVQRDLRSFDLDLLPKTPGQARQPDALPPRIPTGFLEAREMTLKAGGSYPVYSAPDTASLRGAKGRAALSSKGWVQVFGQEGQFILVQYAIAPGHYRVGYIPAAALSEYWDAPDPLDFTRVPARTLHDIKLTDDPLGQGEALLTLKAGQEVNLLSKMGDYAYLETRQGKQTARGFALLTAFDAGPAPATGLRLAELQTGEGIEEVLLARFDSKKLGLRLFFDSQRLSAYEPGDLIRVVRRFFNDDRRLLSIYPAEVALYAYAWQQRYAAGEDMENSAAGLGMTTDGQPIYPPVPPLAELYAQAQAFYTLDGWRIQEMGADLPGYLPHFANEAKAGFHAYKEGQVATVICLETAQGSYVCTIECPEEAAHTWGARFLYVLNTLETNTSST